MTTENLEHKTEAQTEQVKEKNSGCLGALIKGFLLYSILPGLLAMGGAALYESSSPETIVPIDRNGQQVLQVNGHFRHREFYLYDGTYMPKSSIDRLIKEKYEKNLELEVQVKQQEQNRIEHKYKVEREQVEKRYSEEIKKVQEETRR